MRNICSFLRDEARGRSLLSQLGGGKGANVRLLTLQQHIIIIRDERYHSPCGVGDLGPTGPLLPLPNIMAFMNGCLQRRHLWLNTEGIRMQTIEGEACESRVERTLRVSRGGRTCGIGTLSAVTPSLCWPEWAREKNHFQTFLRGCRLF